MLNCQSEVRDYLIDELKKDFIGPYSPDETLSEGPISHYMMGILYPSDSMIDPEEDRDSNEFSEEDEVSDIGTLMAATTNPSAFGLTFSVKMGEDFTVRTSAAKYISHNDEENGRTNWQREELTLPAMIFTADNPRYTSYSLAEGLRLDIRIRTRRKTSVITISMMNTNPKHERPDGYCFFQPAIRVESMDPEKKIFLPRQSTDPQFSDTNTMLNQLLYRHVPEYAVGHGCAVIWENENGGPVDHLETTFIPRYQVPEMTPDFDTPIRAQEMQFLSEADKDDLIAGLYELTERYADWIDNLQTEDLPDNLIEVANQNIFKCRQALNRIKKGIKLLEEDPTVQKAFQLANASMLIQRARITWINSDQEKRPEKPVADSTHKWRPFQLAFFLMVIYSIAVPGDGERDLVDLLWFPTGGGKTEAYLGLTAFTIFLRRLRKEPDAMEAAGVTVLMRYTLRLLTIQQFQRASSLILACEFLRRNNSEELGISPISLGLWVGAGATPNHLKNARKALDELLMGGRVLEGNPYQIQSCPWCGTKITPRHYRVNSKLTIHCPNTDCEFSSGLPLYLVDDDVYNQQPSLVIGTVDKFARLPWLDKTSALFGKYGHKTLPPELIIQDELHLISGPLGSMVGLYETAIDILSQNEEVPAKVIASTATIRSAKSQIKGLYKRELSQFPPPGLDARDSFFAHQVPSEIKQGRVFVGLHTPGKSMKTAELRAYAVLLQRTLEADAKNKDKDPYWTLVGYFNSMRELGGTIRLVEDDIKIRMKLLAKRTGANQRDITEYHELNSRIGADEIPLRLEEMARTIDRNDALDVLLATNMISVGMDIERLGLMVVTGQPKMTSEYIQATSRVGRKFPGLIITIYNWYRPRDRSHFERFTDYHSKLYSQVEPVSVTPFSNRARDKGLHGVFISLVRHLVPGMADEDAAIHFNSQDPKIEVIVNAIIDRVREINPDEVDETRNELRSIIDRWAALENQEELLYGEPYRPYGNKPKPPHLMEAAEKAPLDNPLLFPTLNSLRDVEGESGIYIVPEREDYQ